ncbi:MAG TPA: RNA polymerase sigma factor [Polyangiaceae bacterium]|nr:RNA polymerase sigma factor [Polyangiaceae bacterium]
MALESRTGPAESAPIDSETLFKRYAGFVATFLFRHGARGADLDDLVQDVFLTAHRRGGYRPGAASATTYLAHIALEANLQRRRGEGRWRNAHSDEATGAVVGRPPTDPAQALATKDAARRLQETLDVMDAGHRAVFILFELEGESCESIAAGLEVPIGTVYSRLHAARRAFREHAARRARGAGRDDPEERPMLQALRQPGLRPKESA